MSISQLYARQTKYKQTPDAVAPSFMELCDRPSADGVAFYKNMRIIKDLGIIYTSESKKYKRHYAVFECPLCGKPFKASLSDIKIGDIKSCGCYRRKWAKETKTTHGRRKTRLWRIYMAMKDRCYNNHNISYKYYGAKGIIVCDEWLKDINLFFAWADNNGYQDNLTIDRIRGGVGYCPENCRWVDRFINAQNRNINFGKVSKYRGVHMNKDKWRAKINSYGKQIHIGYFPTERDAAVAYNNYIIENHTHHLLNVITD